MWKELGILLGIGVLAGGYFLYFAPGVTEKNARRVHFEMSKADVEGLFGGPPTSTSSHPLPGGGIICTWQEANRKVSVGFCGGISRPMWVTFESPSGRFGRSFTYSLAKPPPVPTPR